MGNTKTSFKEVIESGYPVPPPNVTLRSRLFIVDLKFLPYVPKLFPNKFQRVIILVLLFKRKKKNFLNTYKTSVRRENILFVETFK